MIYEFYINHLSWLNTNFCILCIFSDIVCHHKPTKFKSITLDSCQILKLVKFGAGLITPFALECVPKDHLHQKAADEPNDHKGIYCIFVGALDIPTLSELIAQPVYYHNKNVYGDKRNQFFESWPEHIQNEDWYGNITCEEKRVLKSIYTNKTTGYNIVKNGSVM